MVCRKQNIDHPEGRLSRPVESTYAVMSSLRNAALTMMDQWIRGFFPFFFLYLLAPNKPKNWDKSSFSDKISAPRQTKRFSPLESNSCSGRLIH